MIFGKLHLLFLVTALLSFCSSFPLKKPPVRVKKTSIKKNDSFLSIKKTGNLFKEALTTNPIANIIKNTYSFWFWLPRRNIPFDAPWALFSKFYLK